MQANGHRRRLAAFALWLSALTSMVYGFAFTLSTARQNLSSAATAGFTAITSAPSMLHAFAGEQRSQPALTTSLQINTSYWVRKFTTILNRRSHRLTNPPIH